MTGQRPEGAETLPVRLYTFVSADVDARLRLFQAISKTPLAHIVNKALDRDLPSLGDMAAGITGEGSNINGHA